MNDKIKARSYGSMPVVIPLEWASSFRPEAVKAIERIKGGYQLKDDGGRAAT